MSQSAQYRLPAAGLRIRHVGAMWLVALFLLAVAVGAGVIALISDGDDATTSGTGVSSRVGGPDETLRGTAAAVAAGATTVVSSPVNGPDETLRGNAAASAVRSTPVERVTIVRHNGGPNEIVRGNAAASAVTPTQVLGGPDEGARGNAAAGSVRFDGPDETARGQAVRSATTP